jgi:formylglycine-generating enzyme required for sulfatase activity
MKNVLALLASMMLIVQCSFANNLQIANVALTAADYVNNYTMIEFDISWENSWRDNSNYDAAWVFIKYSMDNGITWNHAWLNTTPGNHVVPAASTLSVGLTNVSGNDRGMGVFLYRTAAGSGTNTWTNIRLRWEYGLQGIADDDVMMVKVFGVEMVCAPQKSYYLGDGTTSMIAGQYEDGNSGYPFLVTSEAALTLGGSAAGNLSNHNCVGQNSTDDFNYTITKTLPAAYPKGYNAFYCMKYEITQEQYKDFLNTLDRTQQTNHVQTGITGTSITYRYVMPGLLTMFGRNGIRCPATLHPTNPVSFYCDYDGDDIPNETTDGMNIVCNFLSISDVQAYLDWSALRPISELEFEKVCRGPLAPQPNEWAWGDTVYVLLTSILNPGASNEIAGNAGANANANNAYSTGPVRAGIFAGAATSRQSAGAAFYGAMDMSNSCYEQIVSVASSSQRSFTGLHGDGVLTAAGLANTSFWPVSLNIRGGSFPYGTYLCRTSDRSNTNGSLSGRVAFGSGRGGRTAP